MRVFVCLCLAVWGFGRLGVCQLGQYCWLLWAPLLVVLITLAGQFAQFGVADEEIEEGQARVDVVVIVVIRSSRGRISLARRN